MRFLLEKRPDVLVGGIQNAEERAQHIHNFWKAFQLHHGDHAVFEEHLHSLNSVIPIAWHGDEGRGKRRGNTVVVSVEAVIGIHTTSSLSKKRKHDGDGSGCNCASNLPQSVKEKYNYTANHLDASTLSVLDTQWTNMKGHSFLQHFCLFIIPSAIHHEHPQILQDLLKLISADFRRLFYEGLTVKGKHFCAAVIAGKGDLKWFCKIALERSFQNQGVVRDRPCCHECQAGEPGLTWEDLSETPSWSGSRYSQRPWSNPPPMLSTPFCRASPEKHYKRDPFHVCKVGIFRDLAGSGICWLVQKGYYGVNGDFSSKLDACHGVFKLFCSTTGRTAALRTFSRNLFMYPRFSAYPWANTKGSDTMILLAFLSVQCTGFLHAPLDANHIEILQLIQQTCRAATAFFRNLNGHGIWLGRLCAMSQHVELTKFLVGYAVLAGRILNDEFCGFAMKPKLHLLKHAHLELHEWLVSGLDRVPNFNLHNCEQNEDFIGRCCRLSRRLDSRRGGERVIQCCLMKNTLLHRKFLKLNTSR